VAQFWLLRDKMMLRARGFELRGSRGERLTHPGGAPDSSVLDPGTRRQLLISAFSSLADAASGSEASYVDLMEHIKDMRLAFARAHAPASSASPALMPHAADVANMTNEATLVAMMGAGGLRNGAVSSRKGMSGTKRKQNAGMGYPRGGR
jgi:hypothetical protein